MNTKPLCTTVRRTWGNLNPTSRPFKSKKAYNRKDKTWVREI